MHSYSFMSSTEVRHAHGVQDDYDWNTKNAPIVTIVMSSFKGKNLLCSSK